MRTIGVVSVARSDAGIYRPLLRRIQSAPDLRLHLYVSGSHLAPEFGMTVQELVRDGFAIGSRIESLLSSDTPEGIAKSMGLGLLGFAQDFAAHRPDLLVVLGDRFDMYAAALAALPFKIPVAHIHGGELTQGAIDDALRHSMTKLSHLHFVSTEEYGRRVRQLGEEDWRIVVAGALSLDNLSELTLLSAAELAARWGLNAAEPFVLATFHPVTLEYEQAEWQIGEFLAALEACGLPVIATLPNADTGGRKLIERWRQFAAVRPNVRIVDNLGTQGYFSLMKLAAALAGNSSSGILEAASFELPVVNVGTRQQGRVRAANVIDTGYERAAVLAGLRKAADPTWRKNLQGLRNPYQRGHAAATIVEKLRTVSLDERLIKKRFADLAGA